MTRFGPSLLVLMGLLPGIAVCADTTPPAATSTAPTATSMVMPGTAETAPAGHPMSPPENVARLPARGMDMANVEHIYGAPLEKLPPVPAKGSPHHPPITRWIYPTFVVYFEYDHVVHAVIKAHPFKDSDKNHD